MTVLLTRPSGRSDGLAARLRAAGIGVHVVPTVETEADAGAIEFLAERLDGADWLVVTSPVGARIVAEVLAQRTPPAPRLAAVGEATAAVLEQAGQRVDLVPAESTGTALAVALAGTTELAGSRVVLARADAAGRDLPDTLGDAGATVEEVAIYRTVEAPTASGEPLARALADPELAGVVVASGSAVRGLVRLAGDTSLRATPVVSIGPTTSDAVRAAGLRLAAEAARPDDDALFDAIQSLPPFADRRPIP
ncbi:MAG TPA: uroporphyrinogen-III synthase [Candidatus Limnocylindrales bacterium]|nr:uroporphyrinogen-III synthase [Candidatus Limnocylindrales bacterium]